MSTIAGRRLNRPSCPGLTLHRAVDADRSFFLLPADPGSNNVRVLVNRAAVAAIDAAPVEAAGRA